MSNVASSPIKLQCVWILDSTLQFYFCSHIAGNNFSFCGKDTGISYNFLLHALFTECLNLVKGIC